MENFPLNLTDDEKKAYEMLLAFGQLSIGELSQYGTFDFEQVNILMKSLEEKGLSAHVSSIGNRVIPKFPFLATHQHFQELSDKIHQIDYQSKKFFDERKKIMNEFQTTKNNEITSTVQQRIDEFNKHSEDLKQKIDTTIQEFDTELKTIEETYINKLKTKTESVIETEKNKVTEKKIVYDKKINSNQNRIFETVVNHKSQLNSLSDQFTSKISDFSTGYLDEIKNRLENMLNSLREDLTKFETDFKDGGKEWTSSSLESQMDSFSKFSYALHEIFQSITNSLNEQNIAFKNLVLEFDSKEFSTEDSEALPTYINSLFNSFVKSKDNLAQGLGESLENYNADKNQAGTDVENYKNETTVNIVNIKDKYLNQLSANTSNTKEQIESTTDVNKNDISGFTEELNKNFENLEQARKETLTKIGEDMKTQQQQAMNAQKSSLISLESGILEPFNTQLSDMKGNKKKFFSDITKSTDIHYKNLEIKMKDISESLKTKYEEFTEKIQKKSEDAYIKANKGFVSFIKDEQKVFNNHLNAIKKPVPNLQKSTEKQITDISSKISSELEFLDQVVDNQYNNTKNSLEAIQKSLITDLSADLNKIVDNTSDEDEKVTKVDLISKIHDLINKRQEQAKKALQSSVSELDSKVSEPFKKHLSDLIDRKENLISFLNESSNQFYSNINTNIEEMETEIGTKLDNFTKQIEKSVESSFTKLKGDYKNFVKDQFKETEIHLKEEKKNFKEYKKESIGHIKELNNIFSPELKRLEQSVKKFSIESLELFNSLDSIIITGIPDELMKNISRTSEELVQNSQNSKRSLNDFQNSWIASLSTMVTKLQEINQTNNNQHDIEIKNLESEAISVLDKITDSSYMFNSQIHQKASAHTQTVHDNYQELLKGSLSIIRDSLTQIVQEQLEMLKNLETQKGESLTTQEQQIKDHFSQISTKLDKFVGSFRETSQNRVNDREGELTSLHSETTNKIIEETSNFKEKYKSEVQQSIEQHESDYKEHHTELKSISESFLSEIENNAISFLQEVRNDSVNRMKSNVALLNEKTNYLITVHNHFAASVTDAVSTSEQLRDGLIGSVNDHYNSLIKGNEGFSSEQQTTITGGLEILNPKITIMEDFEKIVNNFNYPKITSLPVVGRGAALETLNHYLSDFKAHVTLLTPDPKDIPVDKIFQLTKLSKRITVASMFDMDDPTEKEIIKKLVEQENVIVRNLDKSQYRGTGGVGGVGYPQYIAADRDGEEIFFGAHDLENKAEFAGMVSQNLSYIEFIGKVILSDFLSRARKIDKI
ncbi:MAG: hypothetical protein HeimC3_09470 [Candidatus Heimdallarchaeota archaeon LC_3]|nr:MAG: hypothetical protein HeimC3_09470 [Candidatus Heimdallarchaeota archaeon LC_3]